LLSDFYRKTNCFGAFLPPSKLDHSPGQPVDGGVGHCGKHHDAHHGHHDGQGDH
jgi:hypothetical protein